MEVNVMPFKVGGCTRTVRVLQRAETNIAVTGADGSVGSGYTDMEPADKCARARGRPPVFPPARSPDVTRRTSHLDLWGTSHRVDAKQMETERVFRPARRTAEESRARSKVIIIIIIERVGENLVVTWSSHEEVMLLRPVYGPCWI